MASKLHLGEMNALLLVTAAQSNDHWVIYLTQHILIPIPFISTPHITVQKLTAFLKYPIHYSSKDTTQTHPSLGKQKERIRCIHSISLPYTSQP